VSGLEYIRSCKEIKEKGIFLILGGYQCHVFLDWWFVEGEQWQKVFKVLNGSGTTSVYKLFDEMKTPVNDEEPIRETQKKTHTKKKGTPRKKHPKE
jgi:hypothetical protein